ncbi:P-loop containing nucleoside triphosphate hydrolase superfamily protein [Abeliophyllum distichum]|uniref:P-loop containing nucleoside triphosphate hydrolase superfamily protein n=1 Tax=Abeliophyllum distichum TaxID=126358 RepID=A0ABD1SAR7_9LAMI
MTGEPWPSMEGTKSGSLVGWLGEEMRERFRRERGSGGEHIHSVFDEIEQKQKEVRLFVNAESERQRNGQWRSVPFTHPATMETVVMDADLKTKIKSDLENFLKSKQYYHWLGRVWKRSYL